MLDLQKYTEAALFHQTITDAGECLFQLDVLIFEYRTMSECKHDHFAN